MLLQVSPRCAVVRRALQRCRPPRLNSIHPRLPSNPSPPPPHPPANPPCNPPAYLLQAEEMGEYMAAMAPAPEAEAGIMRRKLQQVRG